MPGIRNFGIISELGWDYDVKLFEDGPPILKIVMARETWVAPKCDQPASKLAGRRDTPKARWRGEGLG